MNENKYSKEQLGLFIVINILLLALITYASTSLTISFFGAIGTGQVKTSNLILGLVNDISKIFFPLSVGIAIYKKRYFHATILIFIIIGTMFLSYLASQGLDLNVSNEQLLNGSNKQELVDLKAEKVKDVNELKKEKEKLINPLQTQIKELEPDFITAKKDLQDKIESINTNYNINIEKAQTQVDGYSTKIENYKVDTKLTTTGYHALSNFLNVEVGTITKYKNIFMEILAIILSVNLGLLLGQSQVNLFDIVLKGKRKLQNRIDSGDEKNNITADYNNDIESIGESRKIGFNYNNDSNNRYNGISNVEPLQSNGIILNTEKDNNNINVVNDSPKDFNIDDVKQYLKIMFKCSKNNISIGQEKIKQETGLTGQVIRGIRYYLSKKQIIEIHNKSTHILVNYQEALNRI